MRYLLLASLLPVSLYLAVYLIARMRAKVKGEPLPSINSKALLNTFLVSMILAIISFMLIFYYSFSESERNDYDSPAQRIMKKREGL
jgi:uncharacterized BrkB/YihY/UPF0761 family membrane protein